ncbi:MAG: ABC transporter ATP-binding protein, partial [Ruminococcus sp.]|nr:ABC transporter ATP-binding protein [Ruminococcus sp.]
MKENVISAENLTVGYGKKIVVGNIDFQVRHGEILTLIGANGSGKSTILKSILLQLENLDGVVFINGKNIRKMSGNEISRSMSAVMTERIDTELMTCGDVIESGRYPYTNRLGILSVNDRKKVEEAMKLVGVECLKNIDFGCISDGQRQRVMLARAICQEPEILVLDEPTSFLDIHHKLELLNILKKLVKEKNLAVVMSLHELDLAQKVSDRIMCINNKRAERIG